MTLNEFIANLEYIRARYGGDIEVWVKDGVPPSPIASIQDFVGSDINAPMSKIVFIE